MAEAAALWVALAARPSDLEPSDADDAQSSDEAPRLPEPEADSTATASDDASTATAGSDTSTTTVSATVDAGTAAESSGDTGLRLRPSMRWVENEGCQLEASCGILSRGDACSLTRDRCGPGLACCRPCGTEGCEHECTPVEAEGQCPRIGDRAHAERSPRAVSKKRDRGCNEKVEREEGATKGRSWMTIDGIEAEIPYSRAGTGLIIIDHTDVPSALRGRKVGERMVRQAVEDARREGVAIIQLCPFAKALIERPAEWQDALNRS